MAYDRSFQDLSGHWARSIIEHMAAKHIAQGTGMDTFEPEAAVSRASFAAFLVRSLGMSTHDPIGLSFRDVEEEAWYNPVITAAVHNGIIDADSGSIRPNEPITREEMIVMLMRTFSKFHVNVDSLPSTVVDSQGGETAFDDAGDMADWSLAAVKQARALGIIEGAKSNHFFPKEQATRAESMAVILRLLEHL
nr:S-layer homology domain-containing protein [Paenibacillus qinlingensis]